LKKYSFIDLIATAVSGLIPEKKPLYKQMGDDDFITILSWLEDWAPQDVYDVAYTQANIPFAQTWNEWETDMKPLPVAVRAEMQSAMEKHEALGNMKALRTYAFVYETLFKWARWTGIVALITFLCWWLVY
jgi:hypothetical protein